jgi:hypothetical protein
MNTRLHALRRQLAIFAGYVALAIAMTWPLASHMPTHVVGAKWSYDSMVNMMILGSRLHHAMGVETLPSAYDNYFCAPVPLSIAYNENLFGLSLLYAPFYLATRDPLLSYNLLLLLSLALSGYCAYLFARRISGSEQAGFLMGVAYAFCPYVMFELGRIQLVAAMWIPLFGLCLHDAIEHGRTRSVVGLGAVFAMQVGSCLYYALFLVVYAAFVGGLLLYRHRRWDRRFVVTLAATAAVTGVLVGLMSYGHFAARRDYPLTRSEDKAAEYSGTLDDLFSVYPENKALTMLHEPAPGPVEPIAFPGFLPLALSLVALLAPVARTYRAAATVEARRLSLAGPALAVLSVLGAVGAGVVFGDGFLPLVVFALGVLTWRGLRQSPLLAPLTSAYALFLLLAFALFLGPTPMMDGKEQIRGPYFFLYHFVPGFDGIRYVSRFAILIMLALSALGALGGAIVLEAARARGVQGLAFGVLLAFSLLELRNAPVALADLPSKTRMPPAYAWLAAHKGPEPLAAVPAYPHGFYGAREDYMALFHQRRTINGKSSWMPPITHAFINEARRFPRRTMLPMLRTFGIKYLLVHGKEYQSRERAKQTIAWIDARPQDFALRFKGGGDYVYELLPKEDAGAGLVPTPALPKGAVRVRAEDLRATASVLPKQAVFAFDGKPNTLWTTRRQQVPGDWFEVQLKRPRPVVAIEISDFEEAFGAPMSFKLSVAAPGEPLREVVNQPHLRIYRDQVYHPRSFVFRIVLPEPTWAERIRIETVDTVAGRWWIAHEAAVWAAQ